MHFFILWKIAKFFVLIFLLQIPLLAPSVSFKVSAAACLPMNTHGNTGCYLKGEII